MLASVVGILETVLRLAPGVLSGSVADQAYSGYHCYAGGIYVPDYHLGFTLRPNCSRDLYWAGHWWRHATNAPRYPRAAVERADAAFLGDSMIYGHGVEDAQTVPSQFHARTGWAVANLGQQGTCLIQMAMRYQHRGAGLQPRVVFVCSHFNDITDAAAL